MGRAPCTFCLQDPAATAQCVAWHAGFAASDDAEKSKVGSLVIPGAVCERFGASSAYSKHITSLECLNAERVSEKAHATKKNPRERQSVFSEQDD